MLSDQHSDDTYWKGWEEQYAKRGASADFKLIHKDGIICNEKFAGARWRILFVLKEPNHSYESHTGGDIRTWFMEPEGRAGIMLRHQLAHWSHTLLNSLADDLTYHRTECKNALLQTAVINLKKVEGGSQADMGLVGWYASQDRCLLRSQIKSINPDLIVAGGTFSLVARVLKLSVSDPEQAVYSSHHGAWVIPMMHPATRSGYKKTLELLRARAKPCFTANGELNR